jgi:hypothetical protein
VFSLFLNVQKFKAQKIVDYRCPFQALMNSASKKQEEESDSEESDS